MVVLSEKDSSHRKSSSLPDANNRCSTISPPPTQTTTAPSLDGPQTIPTPLVEAPTISGGRTANSHVGEVRRILPLPTLTDALIDELIAQTCTFVGEREAVLEGVQKGARELAATQFKDDITRASTFMSRKIWKTYKDDEVVENRSVQTLRAFLNGSKRPQSLRNIGATL